MRIVFMGTPEFAGASLEALINSEHSVISVFCQPDKPQGRGQRLQPPPVKTLALSVGIPVYQPASLREGESERVLRELDPDITVVVAYGKILPQSLIDIPRLGTVNVHASLLPRWRGAAPIQRAIMNGDTRTGVCVQQMRPELDEGDIISTAETEIFDGETYGELYDRLKSLGAALLTDTLRELPGLTPKPQSGEPSYAPPIRKEHCQIDLSRSAGEIVCQVNALNPKPGATVQAGELAVKIFKAHELTDGGVVTPNLLTVPCGGGTTLVIDELQAPGGKRMTAKDYLRGHTPPFS
jgi:methionyl-tRNA formyltransferase